MAKKFGEIQVVFNKLPKLSREAEFRAQAAVSKAAFDIEANAKVSMQGPKTGVLYGNHQASAPKEAPAVDTGALINSITVEFPSRLTGIIAPHTEYAIYLEYGTRNMAPRPFMRPAAEKVRPAFIQAMKQVADER
jgi:HK97 gp10 family phage protein